MQKVQLKSWGNSVGLRIPKNILEDLGLEVDSMLEIHVDKKKKTIVLKPEENFTPYEKLMLKSKDTNVRKKVVWNRVEGEERIYE